MNNQQYPSLAVRTDPPVYSCYNTLKRKTKQQLVACWRAGTTTGRCKYWRREKSMKQMSIGMPRQDPTVVLHRGSISREASFSALPMCLISPNLEVAACTVNSAMPCSLNPSFSTYTMGGMRRTEHAQEQPQTNIVSAAHV